MLVAPRDVAAPLATARVGSVGCVGPRFRIVRGRRSWSRRAAGVSAPRQEVVERSVSCVRVVALAHVLAAALALVSGSLRVAAITRAGAVCIARARRSRVTAAFTVVRTGAARGRLLRTTVPGAIVPGRAGLARRSRPARRGRLAGCPRPTQHLAGLPHQVPPAPRLVAPPQQRFEHRGGAALSGVGEAGASTGACRTARATSTRRVQRPARRRHRRALPPVRRRHRRGG